jgi:hypothetical protein
MPIYTATCRTDAEYAQKDFDAPTPNAALQLALECVALGDESLIFERYDANQPLREITVTNSRGAQVASWLSPEAQLTLAAEDMLAALEQALAALNTAPRFKVPCFKTDSYAVATLCDHAVKKAKGA